MFIFYNLAKFKNMTACTSRSKKSQYKIQGNSTANSFFSEQFRVNSKKLKFAETVNKYISVH